MSLVVRHAFHFAAVLLTAGLLSARSPGQIKYPPTRVADVVESIHGVEVHDPYRWLENTDDPQVQAWTKQQNTLTRQWLDRFSTQRQALVQRLEELYAGGDVGSPGLYGTRYFNTQRAGSQNHAVVYVREGGFDAEPTVAIDPNTFSEDGTAALDWWYPSADGRLVAYGKSSSGDEWSTLYLREVKEGYDSPLEIPRTRASTVAWDADGRGFYYTRYPAPGSVAAGDENYYRHVYYHRFGTDRHEDAQVYGEGRPKEEWPNVSTSSDYRYLFLTTSLDWIKNDLYVRAADEKEFRPVAVGLDGLFEDADVYNGKLYFRTSYKAPRYRIVVTDAANPSEANWTDILPEGTAIVDRFVVADGKLVVQFMEDACSRVRVYDLDGKLLKEIELPTLGMVTGLSGRFDKPDLFYRFESLVHPPVVYQHDLATGEARVLAESGIAFDSGNYVTRQIWYKSKDGTRVPMFVVHKKDLKLDGSRPTVLYGYGGFNISMTPYFQAARLPWLERGGVYAMANLRGGGEFGKDWHAAGRLDKKQNVFDDFIAAAEKLIADGYTKPEKLGIRGGSNGGLLVGALLVQRPDLFKVADCAVPLLDMVRYHNFSIARLWIPEYGSAEKPEQFQWLYAYSPYHHVKKGVKYPAVLFTTAESDSRVDPMHARKMAAALQVATASNNPVLLWVETKAGHGAGKPVTKRIEEQADYLTFFTWQLGMLE